MLSDVRPTTVPIPTPEVARLAAEAGRGLVAREFAVVRLMTRLLSHIEGLDADQRMLDLLEASIAGNINTLLHVFSEQLPIEQLQPTTAAVTFAAYLAQHDVPASTLVRAYHLGQSDLTERFYEEVGSLACSPELRLAVMHHVIAVLTCYVDWIVRVLLVVYEEEKQRWDSTRAANHGAVIARVLADEPGASASLGVATGYQLDQYHVAVVVWIEDGDAGRSDRRPLPGPAATLADAEALVHRLHQQVGRSDRPLVSAADDTTLLAWLPRGSRPRVVSTDDLLAQRGAALGLCVAVGLPGFGEAGFRVTHAQAEAARRLALAAVPTREVTAYGDDGVAIVSRLSDDLAATRHWVGLVLGDLARDDEATARLRETLRVFLTGGASYTEAAALLHLHRNSVRYRIGRAELLRGRSLDEGRLDLELALQACHLLGSAVLLGSSPAGSEALDNRSVRVDAGRRGS